MHPLDQMAMMNQSLANMQGQLMTQGGLGGMGSGGAAQSGALGPFAQDQALGFGARGFAGQSATLYVSTIRHMEIDVAEWLLDWDQ